jgi:hypothetical protein
MNLKSVEGQPPNAARAILARAVLAQMSETDRIVPPGHLPGAEDANVRSVVEEVRSQLGFAEDDLSAETRERITARLDSILRELSVSPERENEARRRLGDRGELWPRAYRLNFPADRETLRQVLVREEQLENVLRKPDAVQHLLPAAFNAPGAEPMSLYAMWIQSREGRQPYVMLVQTQRRGDEQQISQAWRVFHDDLERPMPEIPLQMLAAFVERFGVYFSVGNNDRLELFVPYAHLTPDASGEVRLFTTHGTADRPIGPRTELRGSLQLKPNEDKSIDVALAYTINLTAYQESLRRHRII